MTIFRASEGILISMGVGICLIPAMWFIGLLPIALGVAFVVIDILFSVKKRKSIKS